MAADNKEVKAEIVQSRQPQSLTSLLDHPLMKEIGIPLAKQAIKKEFGLAPGDNDKEVAKKGFGRSVLALKSLWGLLFWSTPVFLFLLGLAYLLLRAISKFFGV